MGQNPLELTTPRLHLRPVRAGDIEFIATLGRDERVMASLGGAVSREKSAASLAAQLAQWDAHEFGRFFVTRDKVFVGLVGLLRADFDQGIAPGIEIAWRLVFDHWGKGYATEAARAVMQDGFERVGLNAIIGITTPSNERSRRVMDRLGMVYSPHDTFEHPHAPDASPLRTHVVYRLTRAGTGDTVVP